MAPPRCASCWVTTAQVSPHARVWAPTRFPSGFTITTAACVEDIQGAPRPTTISDAVGELERVNEAIRRRRDPLCPAPGPVSMPGMLDTILNLGLNEASVEGLARAPITAASPGITPATRADVLQESRECRRWPSRPLSRGPKRAGVAHDSEFDWARAAGASCSLLDVYATHTGERFPRGSSGPASSCDPRRVRIVEQRARGHLPTAQRHPRGPRHGGDDPADGLRKPRFGSGSGVAFTRDPSDGSPGRTATSSSTPRTWSAGVRNTEDLGGLAARMPEVHAELLDSLSRLEQHYGDIQDVEYTIERGGFHPPDAQREAASARRRAVRRGCRRRSADRARGGPAKDRSRLAWGAPAPGVRSRGEPGGASRTATACG